MRDPALPALEHLLGANACQLLAAAVAPAGEQVVDCRVSQVGYRPGRSLLVRYATTVRKADGRQVIETLVALTDVGPLPEGVLPIEAPGLRVGLWRFPFDPKLPGLPPATSGVRVRQLLDRLRGPAGGVRLRTRAYRPMRRAVVQVDIDEGGADRSVLYLKILPPERAKRVHRTHRALAPALPVPRSVGLAYEQGIVALTALPGVTLREALEAGSRVPAPQELLDLLRRLAEQPLDTDARPAATIEPDRHAKVLAAALPHEREHVAELAARCAPGQRDGRQVTVHGDFYEAQVLVEGGEVAGLLDLDGTGPGYPADDLATMIGHLETLALLRPNAATRLRDYSADLFEGAARTEDPSTLARLVAAACLGLATGPFRIRQHDWELQTGRRLDLAESWLRRADGAPAPTLD